MMVLFTARHQAVIQTQNRINPSPTDLLISFKRKPVIDEPNNYDLVVLIDCWDHTVYKVDHGLDFYKRLVKMLSRLNFDTVVFATYGKDNGPTDPYIVENIQSANMGKNLNCVNAYTLPQVFTMFDFSESLKTSPSILIGGLSWLSCVHWRSLGFVHWLQQDIRVYTHEDIVWLEGCQPTTKQRILSDPVINWKIARGTNNVFHALSMKYDIAKPPDIRC